MDALLVRLCEIFRESGSYATVSGSVEDNGGEPRIEIVMTDLRGGTHTFSYWE